jgi:lysophospholipase L1-like esterase
MRSAVLALLAVASGIAVATVSAQTPSPIPVLTLSAGHTGWIAAQVAAPAGVAITVADGGDVVATGTTDATGALALPRAAAWSCHRNRRLEASYVNAGGARQATTATIRTPSCAGRIAATPRPAHPRAGRAASILISDRWRVGGITVSVCAPPGEVAPRCHALALAPGALRGAVKERPTRPGRHRYTVTYGSGRRTTATMLVRPRSSHLKVLATGDSMIQILDDDLGARLAARGPVRLTRDAHISTGITKPFMLDWVAHAAASARSAKPDVTVVFLGANDGFPIGSAPCCGGLWQARYAKRAARMMRSYARGGRSQVYWLLLPTPRRKAFVDIYRTVNRALRAAAARFPGVVELIDLGKVFTPGGRFRQTMVWHGRRESVRQADGVHLSVAGAAIAAQVVQQRMRDDRLVR